MRYFLVDGGDDCDLSNKVDEWIRHGWMPTGGVCVVAVPAICFGYSESEESFLMYYQALIHDGENPFYPGME